MSAPVAPVIDAFSPGNGKVRVTFEAVPTATEHDIYLAESPAPSVLTAALLAADAKSDGSYVWYSEPQGGDVYVRAKASQFYRDNILATAGLRNYFRLGETPTYADTVLTANGVNLDMEAVSMATWYAAGSLNTITRVATTPHGGANCAELQRNVASGVGTVRILTNLGMAVTPGETYLASAWTRAVVARQRVCIIAWYNNVGANLGVDTLGIATTDGSGNWVQVVASGIAPTTAATARVGVYNTIGDVPEGELIWVDDVATLVAPILVDEKGNINARARCVIMNGVANTNINGTNTAMTFDGVRCWAQVPGDAALNGLAQISVEAWINVAAGGSPSGTRILRRGTAANDWWLGMNGSTKIEFRVYAGLDNLNFAAAVSTATVNDGVWHHVVAVYDGATVRLYIDGAQNGSTPALKGPIYSAQGATPTGIASHGSGTSEFFSGGIDEIAFYTRALTAAEVLDHYTNALTDTSGFSNEVHVVVDDTNGSRGNVSDPSPGLLHGGRLKRGRG